MSLSAFAKNLMLEALAAQAVFLSAHDGYPGTDGSNEISGGSPAYARKAMTWNTASSGNLDSLATPAFDIPAATEAQFYGAWDAETDGNFLGLMVIGGDPKEMVAEATGDTIKAVGHGLSDTNKIVFLDGTAPGGLTEGTVYFLRDATTDTFKVAATSGGSAIDLTDTGALACKVSLIVPEAFGSQGTLTASDADISLNL